MWKLSPISTQCTPLHHSHEISNLNFYQKLRCFVFQNVYKCCHKKSGWIERFANLSMLSLNLRELRTIGYRGRSTFRSSDEETKTIVKMQNWIQDWWQNDEFWIDRLGWNQINSRNIIGTRSLPKHNQYNVSSESILLASAKVDCTAGCTAIRRGSVARTRAMGKVLRAPGAAHWTRCQGPIEIW